MRFLVWLLAGILLSGAHAAPLYSVVDLGATDWRADVALNNRGQVAFVSRTHLERYTDGLGTEPLGTFGASDRYVSINDIGQVAGRMAVPSPEYSAAFRYTDGVGVEILSTVRSFATGINNLGQVLVQSPAPYEVNDLSLYVDGIGLVPIRTVYSANDLNDTGMIVGRGLNSAYVYRPDAGFTEFPQLGQISEANALSNAGYIVGSYMVSGNPAAAFRISPDGSLVRLQEALARDALDVNDLGHVVGYAGNLSQVPTAFLYTDDAGVRDLNALIDPASGWRLDRALAINASGQIAGTGKRNGEYRAFRLDPVNPIPEPATLALLGIGLVPLLRRRNI